METRYNDSGFGTERPYGANRSKVTQLIISGLVASIVMMAAGYVLRAMGLPGPDFAALYGTIFNGGEIPVAFSGIWWLGLVWHLVTGAAVFPFIFDYLVDRRLLLQDRWLKGLAYGASLWLIVQSVIQPLAGNGFFSNRLASPVWYSLLELCTWMIFGAVLDGMSRVRVVHEIHEAQRRAA